MLKEIIEKIEDEKKGSVQDIGSEGKKNFKSNRPVTEK